MTTEFRCTCAPNSGHTDISMCVANRHATVQMMSRQHQESLPSIRTPDGKFVRSPETDEEWKLPHGTPVHDGILMRWL